MFYVALLEGVALIVTVLAFTSLLRWHIRQAARDRDLLVNQLCNLAGRPWQDPPSFREPEEEPEDITWAIPEQMTV